VLVRNGLFPTAPSQPRIAISIHLLDFYRALFERSCDAVTAVVSALHTFYKQRGFSVLDKNVSSPIILLGFFSSIQGHAIRDPFRRSFGYAIQWHDTLRVLVEKEVYDALETSYDCLQAARDPQPTSQQLPLPPAAPLPVPPHPTAIPPQAPLQPATTSGSLSTSPPSLTQPHPHLTPGKCARILQQRCPACFGGLSFGCSFNQ